jgi:hypothetical protein
MARPVLVPTKCHIECVPGVNRPYREADLSAACDIEVKKELSYTCTPSYDLSNRQETPNDSALHPRIPESSVEVRGVQLAGCVIGV